MPIDISTTYYYYSFAAFLHISHMVGVFTNVCILHGVYIIWHCRSRLIGRLESVAEYWQLYPQEQPVESYLSEIFRSSPFLLQ
jgi:hypothetical protein